MHHRRPSVYLLALLMSLAGALAQTSPTRSAGPSKPEKVVMRIVGDNGFVWHGNDLFYLHVFDIGGTRVKSIDEFKEAILALQPGTEVIWDAGCMRYHELPVAGPLTSINALQDFCTDHGVTFSQVNGY